MTKSELIKDMQSFSGSGFMTVTKLAEYLGYADRSSVRKYTKGCQKIGYKVFIRDIAENIIKDTKA